MTTTTITKPKSSLAELPAGVLVPEAEQPYEVPENWVWVKLGEVANINPTKPKLLYEADFICSFLSMSNVDPEKGEIIRLEKRPFIKVKKGYTYFQEDDVLFAKITPCMENGNSVIATGLLNGFGFGSTEFYVIRATKAIDHRYIYYLVRSKEFRIQAKSVMTGAVGQQRVPKSFLETYKLALPPLNEQKRIVDKVERLLTKVDEAKRLIDEARESFELRRAAILDKAFRGELTAKWRQQEHPDDDASELIAEIRSKMGKHDREIALDHDDNNLLPEGWLWVKIRDIFVIYGGGTPSKSKPEYWNGDIPWVSPKDMKTLFINYTADTITQVGVENSSTKLASTGSIVMVVRSGILQRKLPVAMLMKDSAVNQDMKIFDSGIVYVNKYLMWYIHGYQKKLLKQYTKSGTTVNSIEFDKFKEHFIPLPSKKELIQIVNLVEHFLSKEDQIIANLDHIANIEKVKQSILSKAFRGELCTNDPTEESAIELLKEVIASKK
jgi:type I restriction enzyme S subunit